jgi:hypothetical protein
MPILGLLTPLAAAIIIGVMINASLAVHADKGVWNADGGYELPLALAAAAACLAFVGPGSVSADRHIGGPFTGTCTGPPQWRSASSSASSCTRRVVRKLRRRRSTRSNRAAPRSYERRNATNEPASSGTARESVRRARSGA